MIVKLWIRILKLDYGDEYMNKKVLLVILCLLYIPILIFTAIGAFLYGGGLNLVGKELFTYNNFVSIAVTTSLFFINFLYLIFALKVFISIKTKALTVKEIPILKYKKTCIILCLLIGFLIIGVSIWGHIEISKAFDYHHSQTL